MIVKKRIKNEDKYNEFKKYEFDLFFIDNINEKKSDDDIYIIVEQKTKIQDAFNSINYVNKFPGLITTSLQDLYDIFNKSGVWKYKYFEDTNLEKIKKQLLSIKSNNIFLSFFCDKHHTLYDYRDVIEELIRNENDNSLIRFGLPYLDDESKNMRLHVFYQ